jgi:hypothetical protein
VRKERRLRVLEIRLLKNTFGPKRDEVTGEWRRLRTAGLYALCSPNIILVITSRKMRWAGYAARMEERRGAYWIWWGNLREGSR